MMQVLMLSLDKNGFIKMQFEIIGGLGSEFS
jgi:hypothetical protein